MELVSTIAISRGTRDMLKELGHKGQTYDELIQDLIERKRMKKEQDSLDRRLETRNQANLGAHRSR
jgi:hypothetical protein